ncbi:hypothetical protein BS47DRAFT_871116 [Hydnum rufescens UP504]|uniref:Uncharacterized protein n=1 Tax=Hydnum rufescens UP504 TaxID=1448309 RepID=A0A9P6AZ31_9AGAM|nr:hypothetical protein BS47DRAFT_871116 [Hydnum rufescens UP504]
MGLAVNRCLRLCKGGLKSFWADPSFQNKLLIRVGGDGVEVFTLDPLERPRRPGGFATSSVLELTQCLQSQNSVVAESNSGMTCPPCEFQTHNVFTSFLMSLLSKLPNLPQRPLGRVLDGDGLTPATATKLEAAAAKATEGKAPVHPFTIAGSSASLPSGFPGLKGRAQSQTDDVGLSTTGQTSSKFC